VEGWIGGLEGWIGGLEGWKKEKKREKKKVGERIDGGLVWEGVCVRACCGVDGRKERKRFALEGGASGGGRDGLGLGLAVVGWWMDELDG